MPQPPMPQTTSTPNILTFEDYVAYTDNTNTRCDLPPPALVIEIVSPGATNRARDYRYKRTEDGARGIGEYWIVDPEEQRIPLCKWVEGQYEDTIITGDDCIASDIIPFFNLTAHQLLIANP